MPDDVTRKQERESNIVILTLADIQKLGGKRLFDRDITYCNKFPSGMYRVHIPGKIILNSFEMIEFIWKNTKFMANNR